jgi:hypothetical protein
MISVGLLARVLVLAGCCAVASSCTDPPHKEMNQAQGALDVARAAGAPTYAPEAFSAAEDALAKSHAAVTQRDYRLALNFALDASERAREAAREAADRKAEIRAEVERALGATDAGLTAVRAALDRAEKAGVPARTTALQRKTVAAAESTLRRARAEVESDQLLAARHRLDGIPQALAKATSEIDAAAAARQPRRPVRRGTR